MNPLLVIPAFNEEAHIEQLVRNARNYLPDVLVVDDGSRDRTSEAARGAGAVVHRMNVNRGKGEALKHGFQYAIEQGRDCVMTIDGDGQHDPDDIPGFLPLIGQYDLILGNRMGDSGSVPLLRRLANFSSSLLVSAACGQRIPDSQTGFRVYTTRLLREVPLSSSHYDLETEVIIKAARRGFRIGHCRIRTIYAAETSRFKNVTDSIRFITVLVRYLFWR